MNAATVTQQSELQYLILGLRGGLLADYFYSPEVFQGNGGTALLVDGVSGAFVAGNIDDPTGKVVNGSAALLPLSELQDPRIALLLHAQLELDSSADYPSVASALLTCPPPCSFTFWPHKSQILAGDRRYSGFDVERHPFIAASVVHASLQRGGLMDLRLIVLVPSDTIIDDLVSNMQRMLVGPYIVMIGAILVLLAFVVFWLFNDLHRVSATMLSLSDIFASNTTTSSTVDCVTNTVAGSKSFFFEFHRAFQAISNLEREMYTLRAFSTPSSSSRVSLTSSTDELHSPLASMCAVEATLRHRPYVAQTT